MVDRRSRVDVGEPLRRVLQAAATTTVGAAAAPARCDAGAAADQMVGRLLVGCAWLSSRKKLLALEELLGALAADGRPCAEAGRQLGREWGVAAIHGCGRGCCAGAWWRALSKANRQTRIEWCWLDRVPAEPA